MQQIRTDAPFDLFISRMVLGCCPSLLHSSFIYRGLFRLDSKAKLRKRASPPRFMELSCREIGVWKEALSSYHTQLQSLQKPDLLHLDEFYRTDLPLLLRGRNPSPYMTKSELSQLMRWKLSRGKWRPRLLDFVNSLEEEEVESSSRKAFQSLPDLSKAISELTVLKGVGPATASAVLAAYSPEVAPFMSDEAMVAALGNKEYTLKQYLKLAEKLQEKAKELNQEGDIFTPSDVERALWSSRVSAKPPATSKADDTKSRPPVRNKKRRRKQD